MSSTCYGEAKYRDDEIKVEIGKMQSVIWLEKLMHIKTSVLQYCNKCCYTPQEFITLNIKTKFILIKILFVVSLDYWFLLFYFYLNMASLKRSDKQQWRELWDQLL